MTAASSSSSVGALRAIARFTAAQGVLLLLLALLFEQFVFTDAASVGAVRASAWLAFFVQILTFSIARLVTRENVIAGWGLGVVVRFATVAFWAFLGIKALGLPLSPALVSLVSFYFVSTLVEPLFLNA